ncbi:RNA polymerase sigma factor [Filimonas zeae]|uniref:RNA polymerase sigma factor n=1 Tax=Filimonas zeae TaxID=1737353 RepID=UPI0021D147F0|nr:sigma-70 family RNA polymerase sigma factor [Filimonas zeae]
MADGNQEAFRQLFHRYRHKVYAVALDTTGSPVMAEDVLQDIFLKIWLHRARLNQITHFKAYLFTATRNHIINLLKKEQRQSNALPEQLELAAGASEYDGEIYLMEKEYGALLQQAISRLPQRQAEAYRLIRLAGLKREVAAQQMGVSEDTTKSHLTQALRNIRAFCMAHLDCIIFLLLAHPFV